MVHDCYFKYLPNCHMAERAEQFSLLPRAELEPKGKSDRGADFVSNK